MLQINGELKRQQSTEDDDLHEVLSIRSPWKISSLSRIMLESHLSALLKPTYPVGSLHKMWCQNLASLTSEIYHTLIPPIAKSMVKNYKGINKSLC